MKKLLLCSAALFFAQPANAVIPDSGEIVFEILRDGKPFGTHSVRFEEKGNKTRVLIDIEMTYDLGPITLFRYEHNNEELWQGNRPLTLASQTNDDGDDYYVDAVWGERLEVEVNGASFEAPASLMTTSYWNPAALKASQLLNTQKGIIEDVTVTYVGESTAPAGFTADHYKIDASLPLDVWYDSKTKEWVGLKFKVRGSEIEYRRIDANDITNN